MSRGEFKTGWFIYQSCMSPMENGGHFSGHLAFQPLQDGTDDAQRPQPI